jgi:integrase
MGRLGYFDDFSKLKTRIDRLSAVSGWTFHDLRRTAATNMARLGTAPHVVEQILNHRSGTLSGVAGIYNRFAYLEEMRRGLEEWQAYIETLVSGSSTETVGIER